MAATEYPVESKSTKDIRRFRRKLDKRNSTLTREEIWQKELEATERLRALGMRVVFRDPRVEPKAE